MFSAWYRDAALAMTTIRTCAKRRMFPSGGPPGAPAGYTGVDGPGSGNPMSLITAFTLLVLLYSLVSRRLESTVVTAPILFTAAGAVLAFMPGMASELVLDRRILLLIAELGLVMTLFNDASRVSPQALRANRDLPARLLSTGMLLTILLGAVVAVAVFSGLTWWEACVLGAILAPTDAGLGQLIVGSERVPLRIRQALNVEAGLNDGLSVPFMLLFIGLAAQAETSGRVGAALARFLGEQLGYGALIGLGVGLAGGALLGHAKRKQWMTAPMTQLGVIALPVLCAIASEEVSASMFIAAFVCGLAVQVGFRDVARHSVEFTEDWGQLLNFFVFMLFGMFAAQARHEFTVPTLVYAVLSLTLIRMAPVALALKGVGLDRSTVLFMGWFGPRGLASIVLGLVYFEQEVSLAGEQTIRLAVTATVLLSIAAHGLSTLPGIELYARKVAALPEGAPELGGARPADGT
jgi:NhaP-type Na+/H+ or K+/H+ antiporter